MISDSLQFQALESKVQLLQCKMDSINQLLTNQALQYEVNKQVDVVNKVDTLYANSFTQVYWMLAVIVGVIGVLLPLFMQYLQNRTYEERLHQLVDDSKEELGAQVSEIYQSLEETKTEIEENSNITKTQTFILQSNHAITSKLFSGALASSMIAMHYSLRTNGNSNLKPATSVFHKACKRCTKEDFKKADEFMLKRNSISLLEYLDKHLKEHPEFKKISKTLEELKGKEES